MIRSPDSAFHRFVAKPNQIELPGGLQIPILYEDRSVMIVDKPAGWMLAPESWRNTSRNLQEALVSSIRARDFWARSRNLKFIRFVHRLDAETTGLLLLAKNPGALAAYSRLFESRRVQKLYLAAVSGRPKQPEWVCRLKLGPDLEQPGRVRVDPRGKPAETEFRVLESIGGQSFVEARPSTGRTHQIRVHLAAAGCPVLGDSLYGAAPVPPPGREVPSSRRRVDVPALALRAMGLEYFDPFTRKPVAIRAPVDAFLYDYGFSVPTF